jgi:hypothetical protein
VRARRRLPRRLIQTHGSEFEMQCRYGEFSGPAGSSSVLVHLDRSSRRLHDENCCHPVAFKNEGKSP